MTVLKEAYEKLYELRLVRNGSEFSEKWLERCKSYYSVAYRHEKVSPRVLKVLYPKVQALGLYELSFKIQNEILS